MVKGNYPFILGLSMNLGTTGKQKFAVDPFQFPVSEPFVKQEAFSQTLGITRYTHTMNFENMVYATFVQSSETFANFSIDDSVVVDKLVKFLNKFQAEKFTNKNVLFFSCNNEQLKKINQISEGDTFKEVLVADSRVIFYGQPVGILVTPYRWSTDAACKYFFKNQNEFGTFSPVDQATLYLDVASGQDFVKRKMGDVYVISNIQKTSPTKSEKVDPPIMPDSPESLTKQDQVDWSKYAEEQYFVVKGAHSVGSQYHFYLETQVAIAISNPDSMKIIASTQSGNSLRGLCTNALVKLKGMKSEDIKLELVIPQIGGGFGGKEPQSRYVALAALFCTSVIDGNPPVKFCVDRETDIRMIGKRHAVVGKYKLAVKRKDFKIAAMQVELFFDAGVTRDCSIPVMQLAVACADNAYKVDEFVAKGVCLFTNKATSTAARSFGVVQAHQITEFAIQHAAEHISASLQKDCSFVEEFRKINFYKENNETHFKQLLTSVNLDDVWNKVIDKKQAYDVMKNVEKFNLENSARRIRGYAVVPLKYGISFKRTAVELSRNRLEINSEGKFVLHTPGVEMGQGLWTKLKQIASFYLGVSMEDIEVVGWPWTNIDVDPYLPGTGASTGTELNGYAVIELAKKFKEWMKNFPAEILNEYYSRVPSNTVAKTSSPKQNFSQPAVNMWRLFWRDHIKSNPKVPRFDETVTINLAKKLQLSDIDEKNCEGRPFYYFNYGAAFVVVEIDVKTGLYVSFVTDMLFRRMDELAH